MNGFMRFNVAIWIRTLITRVIALGPALIIALCQSAIPSLGEANEWLNVLQSVQLPFAVLPLLYFSMKIEIMNDFALTSRWKSAVLWLIAIGIICVNFFLVISHITPMSPAWWVWALVGLAALGYLYLCAHCVGLPTFMCTSVGWRKGATGGAQAVEDTTVSPKRASEIHNGAKQ
jgi:natural resistance-associated macrophage protein